MIMKSELLEKLNSYLASTPDAVLEKEWEAIEALKLGGPDVDTFLGFQNQFYYSCEWPHQFAVQIELPQNMTPDFSGSFFLCNIAA